MSKRHQHCFRTLREIQMNLGDKPIIFSSNSSHIAIAGRRTNDRHFSYVQFHQTANIETKDSNIFISHSLNISMQITEGEKERRRGRLFLLRLGFCSFAHRVKTDNLILCKKKSLNISSSSSILNQSYQYVQDFIHGLCHILNGLLIN